MQKKIKNRKKTYIYIYIYILVLRYKVARPQRCQPRGSDGRGPARRAGAREPGQIVRIVKIVIVMIVIIVVI